eukprot:TRINITY_DN12767_c0_g1_i1.p1 TRINITY_DN12767_c0_g1~~TRINITY_DN12767_c0_g1_i1.p1  ORF type:complete len:424 (+),score=58.41 TRINITY_DN12767_c0_g1_i1:404-1675(+)
MSLRDPFEDDYPPSTYNIGDTSAFLKYANKKVVTVTFANKVYLDQGLLQNLLCSWKRLDFRSFVIVAVDSQAAQKMESIEPDRLHWYSDWWNGISSGLLRPSNKKTVEYMRFIHKRTRFIEALLHQTDLNILLCDADIAWVRNPLTDGTIQVSQQLCDAFVVNSANRGGRGADNVEPLGGFLLVRNNQKIKIWYRVWTAMAACLQSKEQPAMHAALRLINATFIRPFRYNSDLSDAVDSEVSPNLCVLHDAYYPTGFHVSSVYMQDYKNMDLVTLGHASIVNKTGKQDWFKQYNWWLLDDDNNCVAGSGNGTRRVKQAPLPPPNRMPSLIKHIHITNWMKESLDGVPCTQHLTPRIPTYVRQVEEAVRLRLSGGMGNHQHHGHNMVTSMNALLFCSFTVMLSIIVVIYRYFKFPPLKPTLRKR